MNSGIRLGNPMTPKKMSQGMRTNGGFPLLRFPKMGYQKRVEDGYSLRRNP